jgi:hypothetical protein
MAPSSQTQGLRLHAIYTVLGELDLFRASLASIYPFVEGVTVVTTYDRDWHREAVAPDQLVEEILQRGCDPDRKVDLLVSRETNEARNRNKAMDFAAQFGRHRRVVQQHSDDPVAPDIDYFWVVDADEIYTADDVRRLAAHLARTRRRFYQIQGITYFKTWNHPIEGEHHYTSFVRSDQRLGMRRNPRPNLLSRVLARLPLPEKMLLRAQGIDRVPKEVGVFHHGAYVGPRDRISQKVSSFSHSDEIPARWLSEVWDQWTPQTRNFHPVEPSAFPGARDIPTSALPPEIRDFPWPDGYLERATSGGR